MSLKIGISGKRILNVSDKTLLAKSIENNIRQILEQSGSSDFVGYTSLAIGSDTIFAEVVTHVFNMPLLVVLPMPLNEYQKDFDEEDLVTLNKLIEKANSVVVVTESLPADKTERNEAYFKAGKYIADHCDEMLFVWDGLKPKGRGGTAEIIGYHSETKNKIPLDYIRIDPNKEDAIHEEITKEYELSNKQAMQSRDDYKLIWKLAIILGWLAVVLFASNTAFNFEGLINLTSVSLEFILVLVTFSLIIKAKKKDYHGKYLAHRLRAETLRILRYYYHCNREVRLSNFTVSKDKKLSDLVEKINKATHDSPYTSKWYSNYSIKSLIEEQINYHKNKVASIGSKYHLFEYLNLVIAILFVLNLVVNFTNELLEFQHPDKHIVIYNSQLALFISLLLPATYAAFEGVKYFQEWAILKKYSLSVGQSLQESIKELPVKIADTHDKICLDKQAVTMNLISSIMLTDNMNWHIILENKNNYQWVV